MSYEKRFFKTDDGEMYYVNLTGDIYLLTEDGDEDIQIEDDVDKELETYTELYETKYDLEDFYNKSQETINSMKNELNNMKKEHLEDDLTEDIKNEELNTDEEVISTLEEYEEKEENKKSRYFLETKPKYNLEC